MKEARYQRMKGTFVGLRGTCADGAVVQHRPALIVELGAVSSILSTASEIFMHVFLCCSYMYVLVRHFR